MLKMAKIEAIRDLHSRGCSMTKIAETVGVDRKTVKKYLEKEDFNHTVEDEAKAERKSKLDLLVIDDFGLMELDMDKCRNLFEVIDSREGRKSMIVISQFPVSKWFDIFKDHTYGDATMQRLTDKRHSYRLEMNGISMRR